MTIRSASLGALALVLAACGVSPQERLERAEAAYADNRFAEARLDLATLLEEDAADPRVLDLLARTQLQLGDGEGAAATLERLASIGDRPADHDLLMAEAALLRGRHAEALALAGTLAEAEGARIAALAHLGLDDPQAANDAFVSGLERPGDRSRLYADYALFLLNAGDPVRAAEFAEQAREADSAGLDPLTASARIAQARGQAEEALAFYEQAAQAFPESRAAMLGRIGILGDLGRLAEARPLIEEAARRAPLDPDVIYLQARVAAEDAEWAAVRELLQPLEGQQQPRLQLLYARSLVELDLPEQALPRLRTLVREEPDFAAPRRLLAQAQLAAGDAAAAFATIRPLATSAAGSPQDLAILAAAADQSGRSAEVAGALGAAPPAERVGMLLATGDAALQAGRWRAAIDAYEQLRGFTGDSNAMVLNNLAYARSRSGETGAALELAEKALVLAPQNASIMDTTGWLLVQSGRDRARGLALLEQAAALAPDNAAIAEHLAAARRG